MKDCYRFEELRPDQLEQVMAETPIVYWPLGLIEHHGWHLPVGFDGIKAQRFCERAAGETGGLLMPTMWWGSGGGHGDFKWTFYQDEAASRQIVLDTARRLFTYGARVLVLLMGHYPWDGLLNAAGELDALRKEFPDVLIIDGTEVSITPEAGVPEGDHAALQETLYGLSLLPELVDMDSLREGRDEHSSWPPGIAIETLSRFPGVDYDPASPTFAQMGEDPRSATLGTAENQSDAVVTSIILRINSFIKRITTG